MQPRLANVLLFIVAAGLARQALAADAAPTAPPPERAEGLVVLDYQSIPVRGYPSIDLAGVHVLNRFNDWLYGGVGAHAPLVKGEYGGFMSFDATLHAQADVGGRLFADAGVSFGGGGGGNSVSQSRVISGSGAFTKVYTGLGWHFDDFSAGLNVSHLHFSQSVIRGTQLDFAVQVPFLYSATPYASAGRPRPRAADAPADDDSLMVGLDNFIQVRPKGTFKGAVDLADVQFNHFLTDNTYALVEGSVGVRGLPIYNQLLGGLGYRAVVSRDVNVYGQVAVGSGGYDPQQFDTGPGLLVYPKVFGEYRLGDHVGLALSAGYLFAPRGTSRNLTLGAALNYHLTGRGGAGAGEGVHNGYRIDVFEQSELHPKIGDRTQGVLRLITTQVDDVLSDNVYVPIQASVATSRYLGYPGYGEALIGLGVQTTHTAERPFQAFAQLVAGINVHGVIAKPAIGANYGLSDRLAIYAQVGKTTSVNVAHLYPARYRFEATNVGLGLTYRFSLPG